MDLTSLFGVLAVFALVATNGFFVAGEFALVKVRATRVEQLVLEGRANARIVQRQITHLDNYIAATQLGITLASLALGWIGEPSLAHLIEIPLKGVLGEAAVEGIAHTLTIIISFTVITGLHIVLGELVPKSIALQRSEEAALLVSGPLEAFNWLFRPFVHAMNSIGNAVVRMLGFPASSEHGGVHSVEEIEMLVKQSREAGLLDQQEETLVRHIFDFGERMAHQVMTPRTDMVAIPHDIGQEELTSLIVRERYTRYPVYAGTIDSIVGTVHIKDLFPLLQTTVPHSPFALGPLLRPVLQAPETMHLETLLADMRARQISLAIVFNEYGETAGMLTIEDILEEIVGEVEDEFDTLEEGDWPALETLPDGSVLVDGRMSLETFGETFGLDVNETPYETVAGFVLGRLDRLPMVGDTVTANDYAVRVETMDQRRIARVRVIPPA